MKRIAPTIRALILDDLTQAEADRAAGRPARSMARIAQRWATTPATVRKLALEADPSRETIASGERFPLAPLLAQIGPPGFPLKHVARILGVDNTQIHRWKDYGLLADHAATRIGLHPSTVWPDWELPPDRWGEDLDDLEGAAA